MRKYNLKTKDKGNGFDNLSWENNMGKQTQKLTLGTVQLGLNYGIANVSGKPSLDKAFRILDAAFENGIRSFDTAYAYGDSEVVLGKYFARNNKAAQESLITTKIALDPYNRLSKKELEDKVSEMTRKSLERLRMDSVDTLMLHRVTDLNTYKDDIVSALTKVVEKGYVSKIGVSVYTPEDIAEMLKYDELECVQLPINIIDTRLIRDGLLSSLKKSRVSVYARSVFLQGLFFMSPENLPPKLSGAKVYLDKLNDLCKELDMTMAELALGYIRDIKEIDSLVIGAETVEQIDENVKLINGRKIPDGYMKSIREYFNDVPDFYLEPWRWERDEY